MEPMDFTNCIDACNRCALACEGCAVACLQEDDIRMMTRCISLDMDCAQICRTAQGFMARGSSLASAICQACAAVCDECANECAQHEVQHCQECAEACRHCAAECRAIFDAAAGQLAGRAPSFRSQ